MQDQHPMLIFILPSICVLILIVANIFLGRWFFYTLKPRAKSKLEEYLNVKIEYRIPGSYWGISTENKEISSLEYAKISTIVTVAQILLMFSFIGAILFQIALVNLVMYCITHL